MENQDENRWHNWKVTATDHYTNGQIDYERCEECNAKRVVQYPPGMILESDPKLVPRYCPKTSDGFGLDKISRECIL